METIATHCPYCALQCGMHLVGARRRASTVTGDREVPGQQGRPVRQRVDGRGDARASRSAAHAAGAQRRGALVPVDVGRRARSASPTRIRRRAGAARARCGRRLRRRLADQRKGLPARQVRARRARHREHRLQRPLLHVVGGGAAANAPSASTAACRFRSRTSRSATSSCSSAAIAAETMPPIMQYFEAQQRTAAR